MALSDKPIQQFRQRGSVVTGWLGIAVCLLIVGSAIFDRGADLRIPALALAAAGVFWVFLVRPRLCVRPEGVDIDNPLRATLVPWSAIEGFGARWNVRVDTAEKSYASWAISSGTDRPKAGVSLGLGRLGGEPAMAARTPEVRITSGAVQRELESWLDGWESGNLPGQSRGPQATEAARTAAVPYRRWVRTDLVVLAVGAVAVLLAWVTAHG